MLLGSVWCIVLGRGLIEKRACNFHSDCTVGKILIVVKSSDKCMGGAKCAAPVLVGGLG